jgi:hypothetical protein
MLFRGSGLVIGWACFFLLRLSPYPLIIVMGLWMSSVTAKAFNDWTNHQLNQ